MQSTVLSLPTAQCTHMVPSRQGQGALPEQGRIKKRSSRKDTHSTVDCATGHISSTRRRAIPHKARGVAPDHDSLPQYLTIGTRRIDQSNFTTIPIRLLSIGKKYVHFYYLESVKSNELLSLNFNK